MIEILICLIIKGILFFLYKKINLRYDDYVDEDDASSQTPSITNSEFQRKLKSNKKLESVYKLRFSIEKIFLSKKAIIFYKLMCSYGKLIMVKKTMKIFGKIIEQMIRKKQKMGMVKIKRVWYFGRIHDKELDKSRRYLASNRKIEKGRKQHLLYHNGKQKDFYFGF
jgi:hypothetical protein